jgi:hypothetical protein
LRAAARKVAVRRGSGEEGDRRAAGKPSIDSIGHAIPPARRRRQMSLAFIANFIGDFCNCIGHSAGIGSFSRSARELRILSQQVAGIVMEFWNRVGYRRRRGSLTHGTCGARCVDAVAPARL